MKNAAGDSAVRRVHNNTEISGAGVGRRSRQRQDVLYSFCFGVHAFYFFVFFLRHTAPLELSAGLRAAKLSYVLVIA